MERQQVIFDQIKALSKSQLWIDQCYCPEYNPGSGQVFIK